MLSSGLSNVSDPINMVSQFQSKGKLCKSPKFETYPRIITAKITDRSYYEDEDGPKNFILDVQFSSVEKKLFFVVKRENYSKRG